MYAVYWLSALIIAAEGLNKLERTAPFAKGLTGYERSMGAIKSMAWLLLTFGALLIVSSPWMPATMLHAGFIKIVFHKAVSTSEAACVVGFALHVLRARLMEALEYGRKTDRRVHWREN